jgi:hypothetical protein
MVGVQWPIITTNNNQEIQGRRFASNIRSGLWLTPAWRCALHSDWLLKRPLAFHWSTMSFHCLIRSGVMLTHVIRLCALLASATFAYRVLTLESETLVTQLPTIRTGGIQLAWPRAPQSAQHVIQYDSQQRVHGRVIVAGGSLLCLLRDLLLLSSTTIFWIAVTFWMRIFWMRHLWTRIFWMKIQKLRI